LKADIAIYGSHNASVALAIDDKIVEVIEIERFVGVKNAGLFYYLSIGSAQHVVNEIIVYFYNKYGVKEYNSVHYQHTNGAELFFKSEKHIEGKHHVSHASGSFYQSNDQEAIIFSYDGGGNDGFFRIFHAKRGHELEVLETLHLD